MTPQYATEWRALGAELGFSDPKLKIIRANHQHDIKDCCNEMLSQWLRIDSTPSWKKIFNAIDSPAVCGSQAIDKGNVFVHLCMILGIHVEHKVNKLILQYLKTRRCKYYTLFIVYNDTVYYNVKQKPTSDSRD